MQQYSTNGKGHSSAATRLMNGRNAALLAVTRRLAPNERLFYFLFLLNLISNVPVLFFDCTAASVSSIPALSAMTAWFECMLYKLVGRTPALRKCLWALMAAVHNILIIADYLLVSEFNTMLGQQAIDLVMGTNAAESREFLSTYLTFTNITVTLAGLLIINAGALRLAKLLAGIHWLKYLRRALVVAGCCVIGYAIYGFVVYRQGAHIPTYTAITRLGYGYAQRLQNARKNATLRVINDKAEVTAAESTDFDIVLVIGESFSRAHTPLYGYDKPTTPALSRLQQYDSLVVMADAVTIADWTQKVLMSMFSTGRYNDSFGNHPLFPVLFKKAGWHTALYDNEFTVGHDIFFFNDPALSQQMFDLRNPAKWRYDGDLVKAVALRQQPGLYILHLMGQHFTYADRYPEGFGKFKPEDYDPERHDKRQREILAHYDNATLYNDSVFSSIVETWSGRQAVIIYLSDHGEEVYDCRDYMGHGNAHTSPDIQYQIHIPMMVYMTPEFRRAHPDKAAAINKASGLPVTSDDISHMLLDLAGIATSEFDASRSFINDSYDASHPRIVLNSVNYDEYVKK